MSKHLKNISVVAGATMFSRVLGLVREGLTAAVFGTSALVSAYSTAFQLPNLFRRLLAEGGMTAAFVPTLNDELHHRQRAGAFSLINQVASWLFVVSGTLVALSMLALNQRGWLERLGGLFHADTDTIGRWILAAELAVILFPYLVFVCLAAAFSAALQTLNRFLEPALSPIWLNAAMIGLLLAGIQFGGPDPMTHMHWFCAGVLIGGFFQMAVPAWALTREGWRPRFELRWSAGVRMVVKLMAPTVLGSSVYLINMVVSRFIGLSLNDSAVSVLNYATRLMELPIGVFAIAVSTVVFPLISRYAAAGDKVAMSDAYRKGMRLILFINIPAAVGLAVLAVPIIRIVYQHGAFHRSDTQIMMPVLAVFATGLPFFSFVNLVLRAFYAQKDTVTPVQAAVLSFVINVILSFALMRIWGTVGLALAGNVAIMVQAGFLQIKLGRRDPHFAFHLLLKDLAKIALASAAMGVAVHFAWKGWSSYVPHRTVQDIVGLGVVICLGIGLYAVCAWALRVEGRRDAEQMLGKLRSRFSGKKAAPELTGV